jgi:FkbM family methyltransferase
MSLEIDSAVMIEKMKRRFRKLLRKLWLLVRGFQRHSVAEALRRGQVVRHDFRGEKIHWLITNPDDEIQRHQFESPFYEMSELLDLEEFCNSINVVLDIGANIGNHAIFFEKVFKPERIILVEPYPPAVNHLLANISLNFSTSFDLQYLHCAVGARSGSGRILEPTRNNLGLTRVSPEDGGNVPIVSGDEIVAGQNIDLIKIDVEGLEAQVIQGLVQTLTTQNPLLFVEVDDAKATSLSGYLLDLGYENIFRYRRYPGNENYIFRKNLARPKTQD